MKHSFLVVQYQLNSQLFVSAAEIGKTTKIEYNLVGDPSKAERFAADMEGYELASKMMQEFSAATELELKYMKVLKVTVSTSEFETEVQRRARLDEEKEARARGWDEGWG